MYESAGQVRESVSCRCAGQVYCRWPQTEEYGDVREVVLPQDLLAEKATW